jgi:hypothetical protein
VASKNGPAYEQAWRDAKKICRLNARQVEMARALGMNPKKLPGLRPSPKEHWKLPVGEFIEECYSKQFGDDPLDHRPPKPWPGSLKLHKPRGDADTEEPVTNPNQQVGDLVCYLGSLAEGLETWLVEREIAPEVMPQVIEELRETLQALESGGDVSRKSEIPLPPPNAGLGAYSRGKEPESDEEIPF